MTITAPPLSPSTPDAATASKDASSAVKPVRTRRSGIWGFAALALLLLGALGGIFMFQAASNATQVFVAAGDITRGQTIEKDDLTTISIAAGQNTTAISATKADDILGTIAAVDIRQVASSPRLPPRPASPSPTARRSSDSRCSQVGSPPSSSPPETTSSSFPVPAQGVADVEVTADQTIPAVVSQVRPIPNSNDVVVDVYVATQAAPGVTSKGAAGSIALYLATGDK